MTRRVTASLAVWAVAVTVMRVSFAAPEECRAVTDEEARDASNAAANWIVTNQFDDGSFLYLYDRDSGETPDDYNIVRHAGTTMALYQLAVDGEHELVEAADLAVAYLMRRLIDTGPDARAPADVGADAKLGTAALFAVALAFRRQVTNDTQNDNLLRKLGNFMVGQQQPDGSMLDQWKPSTGRPNPAIRSRYATGEALWAIALLHEIFPGDGWDEPALLTLDYLALRRDAEEDLFPRPWPDQWAAYSLGEMVSWGLERRHIEYARELAGQFGVAVRWDSQTEGIARLTHGPRSRGSGFGTVIEGLGSLLRVADRDDRMRDLRVPIATRLACGAARMVDRQIGPDDVRNPDAADREVGAWFTGGETRVDDQQHAASGLRLAIAVLPRRDS